MSSTASGMVMLMEAGRRRIEQLMQPWREVVNEMLHEYMAHALWRIHLQAAADATRYQLTWNGATER